MATPSPTHFSLLFEPSSRHPILTFPRVGFNLPRTTRFKCYASQTGFFTRLGRLIKEKAKSDVEKIFSGFSKTRDNLAVIDELLLYWNLADTDRVLDELEEVSIFHLILLSYFFRKYFARNIPCLFWFFICF